MKMKVRERRLQFFVNCHPQKTGGFIKLKKVHGVVHSGLKSTRNQNRDQTKWL